MEPSKRIITTGESYVDIDGFACVAAYRDLVRLRGIDAVAVLPGPLNHSVTPIFKAMGGDFLMTLEATGLEKFVIMDVSRPDHIAKFVDQDRIAGLFDHHFGFEEYWRSRLGEDSKIEAIGACATFVWEAYKKYGFEKSITKENANLLAVAIVSNTLNFRSSLTHDRDRIAFAELQDYISLPADWIADYFQTSEKGIFDHLDRSIANDTKVLDLSDLGMTLVIGQIELWNGKSFIEDHKEIIEKVLAGFGKNHWFMSVPSISENKNYFYTKDVTCKMLLEKAINVKFDGEVGTTGKLWMRKEILRDLKPL